MIPNNLGFVAALLLGLVLALVRWPELGTLLAIALLYLNLLPIAIRLHGVPPFVVASASALAIPALYKHMAVNRGRVVVDRPFLLMLGFLACMLVSSFVAKDMELALSSIIRYLTEGLLVYLLFINLVRTAVTLRRVIWVLVLCGAFLTSLTVYQEFTGSYSNEFGGLAGRYLDKTEDDPTLKPEVRAYRNIRKHRSQGPIDDPNRYAQLLVVLLPLGWCLIRSEASVVRKVGASFCSSLIVAGVFLTYSRGAMVALIVMLCVMVVLRVATARQFALAAAVPLLVAVLSPGYGGRMVPLLGIGELLSGPSTAGVAPDPVMRRRATLMTAAWNVFLDHPILGVGPGQFEAGYSVDYSGELHSQRRAGRPARAHSMYLELAAETGLLGLGVFVGIVIAILRRLAAARRRMVEEDPFLANLCAAFVVAIFAYLTTAVFLQLTYQRYYWLLLALAGATAQVAASSLMPRSNERLGSTLSQTCSG